MTHGSLFSGIGGIDLGFDRAGIETLWQVENDPYAIKVLEKHWPNVRRYKDVKEVHGIISHTKRSRKLQSKGSKQEERRRVSDVCEKCLRFVDIISGGFPCQPVSHAGKRRGEADDRWLWPEMFAVIRTVRPAFVVAENVLGLVSHKGGVLLDQTLSDLERAGYETLPPIILPACSVEAPHLRYRVFIMAHTRHHNRSAKPRQQQETRAKVTHRSDAGISNPASQRLSFRKQKTLGEAARNKKSQRRNSSRGERWPVEPSVRRVAHGVPSRVDKLRCLGNAVVPQVAEFIGRCILEAEQTR